MKPLQPLILSSAPPSCCASTPAISSVTSKLSTADILGSWMVRWGINRNNYRVEPKLYALGCPTTESPVLVTANYKLTFDSLRKELGGLDLWLLVLDTKGVNVWCAAGKGTFGTAELVHRIKVTALANVVSHRTVILPQLGAPGVSAHETTRLSGFKVIYGPVRASDIKPFLSNGMITDAAMRTVNFTTLDRLVLTPVELVSAMKYALLAFGLLFIANSLELTTFGATDLFAILGAIIAGCVLTPLLLPWIPGRMFSFKGALLGLVWAVLLIAVSNPGILGAIGYTLLIPSISAFLAMNFTGASTYTSFSGVKKEMQISIPPIILFGVSGAAMTIANGIIRHFS